MTSTEISVTVHLHTVLQMRTPQGNVGRLAVVLPAGSTVRDVLQKLEVEMSPEALMIVVNGRSAEPEAVLRSEDEIHLIPAISGGGR